MRILPIKTLFCLIATGGAMAVLLADKTAAHRTSPGGLVAQKTFQGNGSRAVVTVTGPPVPIAHGVVQVRITVADGHVTSVVAIRLPNDNQISWGRSVLAAGVLAGEAMTAQSAHIDAVSGATYTSEAYKTSLQAALDAGGVIHPG